MQYLSDADPERLRRLVADGEFFWLDLVGLSEDEVARLPELIGLDPEAASRALRFGSVPEIRHFKGQVSLVFFGAEVEQDASAQLVEVHLLVSGGWVITFREHELTELKDLAADLSQGPELAEADVVGRILAALADSFADLMDANDDAVERIESSVAGAQAASAPAPTLRREILERRGKLFRARRTVRRERDYIDRAIEELSDISGLEASHRHLLRDVGGQMIRLSDRIDDALDRLGSALDLLNSTLSNRLNVITERLTVVATIFLPLTVVTGFFGQNFGWMVNRIDTLAAFLIFGIGVFGVSGIGIYLWVRRRLEPGAEA